MKLQMQLKHIVMPVIAILMPAHIAVKQVRWFVPTYVVALRGSLSS